MISFSGPPYEQSMAGITFVRRPDLPADQVILPEGTLDHVRAHVVGLAEHREELRARGQHLKRGILLYGPPGTGKTHTVRHLIGSSQDTTVVLLSGQQFQFVTDAAQVARAHQPAIVVLEDCDLVAEDRDYGPSGRPLLFTLLDAMDGLDADADVTFLLTTNRVQQLERALVQRPGRVDLAVEIPLPDAEARAALIRLYFVPRRLLRRRQCSRRPAPRRGPPRRTPRNSSAGRCCTPRCRATSRGRGPGDSE